LEAKLHKEINQVDYYLSKLVSGCVGVDFCRFCAGMAPSKLVFALYLDLFLEDVYQGYALIYTFLNN
jgi:hypothetical protein